jgi:5-methylcytosine-specific restriction endonuclease McrA
MGKLHNRNSREKRAMRDAAIRRQRNRCCYCGEHMRNPPSGVWSNHPDDATLEHRVPLDEGGSWRRENLRAAHRRCNEAKDKERLKALRVHG